MSFITVCGLRGLRLFPLRSNRARRARVLLRLVRKLALTRSGYPRFRAAHHEAPVGGRDRRSSGDGSDNKQPKIKILGNGELTKKFTVKVPCSASAKAKIEKAGGSVA